MSSPTTVSITTLRDFLECRRRGRFQEGWKAPGFIDALSFGSAIHAGLEAWYKAWPDKIKGTEDGEKAITLYYQNDVVDDLGMSAGSFMTDISRSYDLAWSIFQNYIQYEEVEPLIPSGCRVLWVEKRIRVPLLGVGILSGQIDLAYVDENGEVTIVDHKTSSKGLDNSSLDVDEQVTGYCYLTQKEAKVTPVAVIYNTIIKQAPSVPILLKSGKLSKDATQATTSVLYRKAIEDNHLDVAEYQDFLDRLDSQTWSRFFQRIAVRRTETELAHFESYVPYKIKDIALSLSGSWDEAYPAPSIYRCGYCPWVAPCKSMLAGEDWEAVLNSKFVPNTYHRK